MTLARRYNSLACITTLLASLSYCAADDGTFLLGALSIAACVFAWFGGRSERPWSLPRWVINLLMLAAIIDATIKVLGTRSASFWSGSANMPIVSTLSQFLVYILLAKLFDRRTVRDEAHLLSLATFVVVGAVLTSNTLVVGALIFLFAPSVICSAMLLQVVGGARAVEDWARHEKIEPPRPLVEASGAPRRFRRDFAGAAAVAVVGTLVLACFTFVLLPRGMWKGVLGGFGRIAEGAQVGFTDTAQLGQEGLLRNSNSTEPVMHVRLSTTVNGKVEDLGEIRGTLYLRGAVKNFYNRSTSTWEYRAASPPRDLAGLAQSDLSEIAGPGRSDGQPGFEVDAENPLRLGDPERGQIEIRQTIDMDRPMRSPAYFFTIWRPLEVRTGNSCVMYYPGRDLVLQAGGGRAVTSGPVREYTVVSAMEYADEREPERPNIGFDSDVVKSLALSILGEKGLAADPAERDASMNRRVALAFVDHLRTRFEYSREMERPRPGEDPIEMFLTRTRRGHCEYFASALVALCHSVGLDARYVAGYLATEYNNASGRYVVRESNAHAWTEVRLAPGRWQTFDASPQDAINEIHRPRAGLLAQLQRWYEAINITWATAVVDFDSSKQQKIIGDSDGWQPGDFFQRIREVASSVAAWLRLAVGAMVLIALAVALRFGLRMVRQRRSAAAPGLRGAAIDPAVARLLTQAGFYQEALDVLAPSGLSKPLHRPPVMHAGVIGSDSPLAAAALRTLADLYYTVRFGHRPLSGDELAAAQTALASLREHVARRAAANVGAARDLATAGLQR